jgi:signal transduction histidine kinase/ligand-binding sensor protein
MARIERLIGDLETFRMVLEGTLARWEGVLDVMPADPPPTYLFEPRAEFASFCKMVRSTPEGEALCVECDREHARLAEERGEPIHYICHAGMLDIAAPILVEGESLATIFCGQCRSWDEEQEREGERKAIETAKELGFRPSELLKLRKRVRRAKREEVEDVKRRLSGVATYMAATGHQMQELLLMRSEALRESQHIQSVMTTLTTIVDVNEFWSRLDRALESICNTIGADYAVVFVSEPGNDISYRMKSLAGLGREDLREYYSGDKDINDEVTNLREPWIVDFAPSVPDTLCYDLAILRKDTPDKVAMVPFDLTGEHYAVMVFFLDAERDVEGSLPIEKEMDILSRIAPQIATAYQNCLLYTLQKELARERDIFLEDVGHQLIAPLSGIQAASDRLHRHFDKWDRERIDKQVLAIRAMSRWAARLTRNLVWVATTGNRTLHRRWTEITGLLIGCAIDVQGMAAHKDLRIRVDEESTDALPHLFVDQERFIQAVVNLLDNAVKYSKSGTEIWICASRVGPDVHISVTNYGIPLRRNEMQRIFERGYRSEEAREIVPGGTGIGLSVAREIIRLHGGELSASPSVYDEEQQAHEVVFTITLSVNSKEV